MPTNVPPQYRDAEQRFRDASTIQAKIAALQEMLQIMPKHKGTDHLKAQLRSRLSRLMSDLETSSGGKGGRTEPFSLPKEGAGRVTLIGPTNVGKSQILTSSTGAKTKVGAYELSTQEPVPGMYPYGDIYIQMVDTPPITNRATQSTHRSPSAQDQSYRKLPTHLNPLQAPGLSNNPERPSQI